MARIRWGGVALAAGVLALAGRHGRAADAPAPAPSAEFLAEGLRLDPVGGGARSLLHEDPVEASIVAGTRVAPRVGDEVAAADGSTRSWERVGAQGTPPVFEGDAFTKGAYLSCRVASATERVAILHAKGHDFVYVNGELRPGDPYGYGWLRLPVLLRAGGNEFLFRVSRGRLEARLEEPPAEVFVLAEDATLPTCEVGPREHPSGRAGPVGAVVVVNAGRRALHVGIRCAVGGGAERDAGAANVPPLSARKVTCVLPPVPPAECQAGGTTLRVTPWWFVPTEGTVVVRKATGRPVDLAWKAAGDGGVRRKTFVSDVDGSVQYYATREATREGGVGAPRAIVLSLHGAGVEAEGQAAAYAPKRGTTIVCPTNRRPFGFDWEDWGRLDALEALGVELVHGDGEPSRVHVTGHSMGGHGAWHLGVTYPGLFATVAPSAGWRTFATYGGGPTGEAGPAETLLRRATSAGDVPALATNLATKGVYVLHGDADDNVPVAEARAMVERLKGIVPDLHVHERPGAGHWWDASPDEPGTDCVDWAPMFDLMARRRLASPAEMREVDFATASPGVSARLGWAEIECQVRAHAVSRVRLRLDPGSRRITGTTENVRALVLRPDLGGEPLRVALDGDAEVVTPRSSFVDHVRLVREGGGPWALRPAGGPTRKHPERYGPFKEAFRHRFAFVVGTTGTAEETTWARNKARLDAETWWYRGNGTVEVLDDHDFVAHMGRPGFPQGNVILYGHADMNAAWAPLLPDGEVRVGRGALQVGGRRLTGDDLACLFVRPRAATHAHLVGVVAGTGLPALRLTDRLPYLASGVGVPDLVVLSTSMLTQGADGLVGAGFFGPDWSVDSGEFAWREPRPTVPR
jgi:poly(3-hydroxybutyrate) depolymerase